MYVMNMNTRELINTIKKVSLTQTPVKSVYDGDVYEVWNSSEINFGSMNIGLQNITYDNNLCTYTFVIYYGDRLLQDKSNVNNIYTDGVNAIQSVLNILNEEYRIDISENIRYIPFQQEFMDYLAGVYATVDMTTDSTIGLCSIDKYEYIDDREVLIERLIETINEYKVKDAELANLLQEILYKIDGEISIVNKHEYNPNE